MYKAENRRGYLLKLSCRIVSAIVSWQNWKARAFQSNEGRWHFVTMLLINPTIFYPRHTSETVQPIPYPLSLLSASSKRCHPIISERPVSPPYDPPETDKSMFLSDRQGGHILMVCSAKGRYPPQIGLLVYHGAVLS